MAAVVAEPRVAVVAALPASPTMTLALAEELGFGCPSHHRAADPDACPLYVQSSLFSDGDAPGLPRLLPPPGLEAWARHGPDGGGGSPGGSPGGGRAAQHAAHWVDDLGRGAKEDLAPLVREIVSGSAEWAIRTTPAKGESKSAVRWWSRPGLPLLCPVSEFPICLLPYPPFKLRVDPDRAHPFRLVDGKFLAMEVIVSGRLEACGRALAASDVAALDEYIHRCKLGPFRVSRLVQLSAAAAAAGAAAPQTRALESFQDSARGELEKLRRIQENRLAQVKKLYQARCPETRASTPQWVTKNASLRGRPSDASTASTRASSGSIDPPTA